METTAKFYINISKEKKMRAVHFESMMCEPPLRFCYNCSGDSNPVSCLN